MNTSVDTPTRRPGVVSFIGIILYVQAFLAAIAAVSLLIWRNDILDFLNRQDSPLSNGAFTGTIVGEAIAAILLFVVANGIMRGSNGFRLLVAIVQGLSMASAVYILVAHHVGGALRLWRHRGRCDGCLDLVRDVGDTLAGSQRHAWHRDRAFLSAYERAEEVGCSLLRCGICFRR